MNKSGSCLLLLTLISSVILILAINSWQTILFSSDLVGKKYEYELKFRMLEGLHNFGIFKCINSYRKISNKNPNNGTVQSIILYNGPWPLESGQEAIKLHNVMHQHSIIKLTINEDFSVINSRLANSETGESYAMESKIKKIKKENSTEYLLYDWQF